MIYDFKFSAYGLFEEAVDIEGETELVGEIGFGKLANCKSYPCLFDLHSCTKSKTGQRLLVRELQFSSAAMVVTESDIELLTLGHHFDRPYCMAEEHVVPFHVVGDDISGGWVLIEAGPFVVEIPGLHVMNLEVETQRSMLDAIGETELEIQRKDLVVRPTFFGVESLELPTYVREDETHLEGRVARLEMRAYIGSDREGRIALIDGIDGFEGDAYFPTRVQLTGVHDIDEDIARAELTSGEVSVLVGILHTAVIEVMDTNCEIVGFIGFSFSVEGFLYFRAAEVMSVEYRTEHRAGQIVGIVELQRHVAIGMEQGRVAHTHRDISVAEADVTSSQRIEAGGGRQTHEREDRTTCVRYLREGRNSHHQRTCYYEKRILPHTIIGHKITTKFSNTQI